MTCGFNKKVLKYMYSVFSMGNQKNNGATSRNRSQEKKFIMAEGINNRHGFDYFQFDGPGGKSKCGTLSMQNFNVKSFMT